MKSYPSVCGKKHLCMWHNGNDYVVAETIDDARLLLAKSLFGESATEWDDPCSWGYYIDHSQNESKIDFEDIDGDGWEIFPLEKEFTLVLEDNTKTRKSVSEWIEEHGEGYFASIEY